jgi:hypothetical protein
LTRDAVHAPLGALGTTGRPAERGHAPRGSLPRGGKPLAAQVIGELLDD